MTGACRYGHNRPAKVYLHDRLLKALLPYLSDTDLADIDVADGVISFSVRA